MNEIARRRTRDRFSSGTPANVADSQKNVCDRLLFSVMVNTRARSPCDHEQATPGRRRNAEPRRDRGEAFGARRLRCSPIEFSRADDVCMTAEELMASQDQVVSSIGKLGDRQLESY